MYTILLVHFFISQAQADPGPIWQPMTSTSHTTCDRQNACRVNEVNGNFAVEFVTSTQQGMLHLDRFNIKNLASGVSQQFSPAAMNDISADSFFEVDQIHIRPGGVVDIALHAFNSAREGKVYYYFIYDAKKKTFVMSDDTFPRLANENGVYFSDIQHAKYKLGADFKFTGPY